MLYAAAAKLHQSCPTLCDPIDGSPPGSSVPGILPARTLQWVAISFSNAWKWKVKVKSLSRVQHFKTPWTVAYQAPLSMGFSRQAYWSGLPFLSPQVLYKTPQKRMKQFVIQYVSHATEVKRVPSPESKLLFPFYQYFTKPKHAFIGLASSQCGHSLDALK